VNPISSTKIINGTKAFVRCDLDVPVENGEIKETYRLHAILPTLILLKNSNANIIIAGHMGKPKGRSTPSLSTKVLLPFFNKHLGEGGFELLENLRFDPGEEANDPTYAKELAAKAEIYINESFATSHREHASIVGIPKYLPSFAGNRLVLEVATLSEVRDNPKKPLVTIIGGAKLESKLPVVNKFLEISDAVLIGGKLGLEWKGSIPDNMYLPKDYAPGSQDIGFQTIKIFSDIIKNAKTIIWAGPMGAYENEAFIKGTKEIAEAVIASQAYKVVGGGDTLNALDKFGYLDKFSFVSTGGGAMLEFLAKGTLPGLGVLGYQC